MLFTKKHPTLVEDDISQRYFMNIFVGSKSAVTVVYCCLLVYTIVTPMRDYKHTDLDPSEMLIKLRNIIFIPTSGVFFCEKYGMKLH